MNLAFFPFKILQALMQLAIYLNCMRNKQKCSVNQAGMEIVHDISSYCEFANISLTSMRENLSSTLLISIYPALHMHFSLNVYSNALNKHTKVGV